ncbi:MAG: FAD-dependent oxidoreductase [Gammaproteobacteria bacterium]|nr:FAD-dependent oxidoreductase [Gammaproteobacteria bacterium]
MQTTHLDIAIFGAGIAGLWTLARLRKAGYRVALFERAALGGVQSIASQGIIHGGTKYALTGKLTGSAMAIGEMPGIWRDALSGNGEVDLREVHVLARHQLLWTTGSLASGMAGFFAGKVMQSRMQALPRSEYVAPFDRDGFRGSLYRLEEPVLDTLSLIQVLHGQLGDACVLQHGMPAFERADDGWCWLNDDSDRVCARRLVLCAGQGNAALLAALGRSGPRMQTRPLHMLMLRGDLPLVQAHCLGPSANPRLTVTSYAQADGRVVWYLGGQVAEEGVKRDRDAQIAAGRAELDALLPWIHFDDVEWATLPIERAEIATEGGRRPDDAYVGVDDRVLTCWPTKLAFAPRVARLVEQGLEGIQPSAAANAGLPSHWPRPPLARLPWDAETRWT